MPYKKHDPVPLSEMSRSKYQGHNSICQKLRDMYYEVSDEKVKMDIRVCMAMAKSMNKKLQYYKHVYVEGIPPAKDEVEEMLYGDT